MDKFPTTIYDFGMNNGDDVAYYLKKADRVVAVEANVALCRLAEQIFELEISNGRLTILNVALSDIVSDEPLPFYIHKNNHVISQLPRPSDEEIHHFEEVLVPQRTADSIIKQYGIPHYVKIDIEHYDQFVLKNLFESGISPDYISAESHSAEVFCLLGAMGYKSFNLVDGASVEKVYKFPEHSAGPFGADILTPWHDLESFFYLLAAERLGWKDIHASMVIEPQVFTPPSLKMGLSEHLRDLVPSIGRAVRHRLGKRLRQSEVLEK